MTALSAHLLRCGTVDVFHCNPDATPATNGRGSEHQRLKTRVVVAGRLVFRTLQDTDDLPLCSLHVLSPIASDQSEPGVGPRGRRTPEERLSLRLPLARARLIRKGKVRCRRTCADACAFPHRRARANCELPLAECALCTPETVSRRDLLAQVISAQSPIRRSGHRHIPG
jgi:hypothetical protein